MEFISKKPDHNKFESLLYALQQFYPLILPIARQYTTEVERVIPGLAQVVPPGGSPMQISHAFTRCFTTRHILSEIFGMEHWYTHSMLDLDNVHFRVITIGGADGFPDHTFVTIKYNGVMYILQSYYHGYTLTGKYGVIKLDSAEEQELDGIFGAYKKLARATTNGVTNLVAHVIKKTNTQLSKFTGIDPSRHFGNVLAKTGPNEIIITETYANALAVFNHVQNKISGLKKIMIDHIMTKIQTLQIHIEYQFADAFLGSSHPSLGPVDGKMCRLGLSNIDPIFAEMTGVGLAGNIHGVILGPIASPTGQIIFPAYATIHMNLMHIITTAESINDILNQLILTANVQNARDLMHYHDELADVLTVPIDRQDEKFRKVFELVMGNRLKVI
jgi:hypothetical protein